MATKLMRAPGWVDTWIEKLVAPRRELAKPPTQRELNRGIIRDAIAADPDGRRLLRDAALRRLQSGLYDDIARGIADLAEIGERVDIAALEYVLQDPRETLREDARACIAELSKRN